MNNARKINTKTVEEYYDLAQKWYSWFYFDKESLGIHYGFWDMHTLSKKEALINQYREIARLLKLQMGDLVLDAGCGVGGASLWLAKNTPANFVGITLSSVQLQLARKYAKKRKLENRVKFHQKDYFSTGFTDEKFHKIFGIESFNHSYPCPEKALSEMWRVLKPGGGIVISDGFLLRYPANEYEKKLAHEMQFGFKMNGWCIPEEIISAFKKTGFKNISFFNKTKDIKKSAKDIYYLGKLVSPLRFLRFLGLVSKTEVEQLLATNAQKKMYDMGLFGYGIFYAEK